MSAVMRVSSLGNEVKMWMTKWIWWKPSLKMFRNRLHIRHQRFSEWIVPYLHEEILTSQLLFIGNNNSNKENLKIPSYSQAVLLFYEIRPQLLWAVCCFWMSFTLWIQLMASLKFTCWAVNVKPQGETRAHLDAPLWMGAGGMSCGQKMIGKVDRKTVVSVGPANNGTFRARLTM